MCKVDKNGVASEPVLLTDQSKAEIGLYPRPP